MKNSTQKRLERKWENLPRYFVDTSVFLELAFKQEKQKLCGKLFNLGNYKLRIETSSIVLGEIVKSFNDIPDRRMRSELFFWLDNFLLDNGIFVHTPTNFCFDIGNDIKAVESHLGSVDCLIFIDCIESGCKIFATLDSDFSSKLGKEYGIKICHLD